MMVRGQTPGTTAKVFVNRMTYAAMRSMTKQPAAGWLHSRWHWYRAPFSLRGHVIWSAPLRAWFCPEDESAMECMFKMPSYEPVDWVAPRPGGVFIDVGAYIGWYAIQAAHAVGPAGRVIALEPDAANRRQLERNLALNAITNCSVIPYAAWSKAGRIGWRTGDEPVWHGVDESQAGETIEAVTVDEIVSQRQLDRVDWIKMDIEGGEIEALRGAEETLARFRPALFIEIHETETSLRSLLDSFNYRIEREAFDQLPNKHGWMLARPR